MITASDLQVEPVEESSGICAHCGNESRSVWGNVYGRDGTMLAAYFVHWTVGGSRADHPANYDFILGGWGDEATPQDRYAVSLIDFDNEDGGGVMVIDASSRNVGNSDLAGTALAREDVVGTPLATMVFAIFDAVFLQDERLYVRDEMRGEHEGQ